MEARRVADDRVDAGVEVGGDGDLAFLRGRANGVNRVMHQPLDRDDVVREVQLAGDDPRDVQDVVDEARLQARASGNRTDSLGEQGIPWCHFRQQARPSEDRGHRRPELVRERHQKLVLGAVGLLRRLVRRFGAPLGVLCEHELLALLEHREPSLFGKHPFGDVAGDLGETAEGPRGVVDRGDDDVRPESGAILADAPSFAFGRSVLPRQLESLLRFSGGDILLRIENREMLPDDLLVFVPLDPARPEIPGRDLPVGIENEDGVIAHRIDEETHQLLGFPVPILGSLALRQIPGHLREADELSALVAQGGDHRVRPEPAAIAPNPPSLVFHPSLGVRDLELPIGLSSGEIFFNVETGEGFAEDLLARVAHDSGRTPVPRSN